MGPRIPVRVITAVTKPPPYNICTSSYHVPYERLLYPVKHRPFTTASNPRREAEVDPADRPRWQRTPPAMAAPIRSRPVSRNKEWRVNDDPRRLDEVYKRILGTDGDTMLPEEVKWLAVTHKSFDHGRRGFNDRLAILGKRIVDLQLSLALFNSPRPSSHLQSQQQPDEYGRIPFQHPALAGLDNLTDFSMARAVDKRRLSQLALRYGLGGVIRWSPRMADNLQGSGIEAVLAHAMYAIVGAVALQKGGEVAITTVRDRIFNPLGIA